MAARLEGGQKADERASALAPFAWKPVLGVATGCFLILMLVAGRYGYHRDELYFVAASKHMAWGYVDQPPLSVALVWVARHLFGDSLYGPPAVPGARVRGGRDAQRASRPASSAAAASRRRSRRFCSASRRS